MGKESLTVRRATAEDNVLLAEMGARTFYESFAGDNTPEDMTAYLASAFGPEKQAAELADSSSIFLIAQIGSRPVGYARLKAGDVPTEISGKHAIELVRIYANKDWIGRGVGAALMQACRDAARRGGHQTLWLGVWERNARALEFYRRWGFRVVGSHVFQLGSDAQTDYIMESDIGGEE